MISIRGKRGRNVSVIITEDVKGVLYQLIAAREACGIDRENAYLFPRTNGLGHIEGHICLRSHSISANLEYPERICSTNMRKYIATVVQVKNVCIIHLFDIKVDIT
jgi:hypothetical protein